MSKKTKKKDTTRPPKHHFNKLIAASEHLRSMGYTWKQIDVWLDMTFEARMYLYMKPEEVLGHGEVAP